MRTLTIGLVLIFLSLIQYSFTHISASQSVQDPSGIDEVKVEYKYNCSKGQIVFTDDKTIKCNSVKRFLAKVNG